MNNNYYEKLLIEKLKYDIISEISIQCNDHNELIKVVNDYFNKNSFNFEYHKKNEIYRDREKYKCKENKCLARVWNTGMGGQCSRVGEYDGFCKYHFQPSTGPGKDDWWLGTINNHRPERPVNHTGKEHKWKN
jgi:hypothetical protein